MLFQWVIEPILLNINRSITGIVTRYYFGCAKEERFHITEHVSVIFQWHIVKVFSAQLYGCVIKKVGNLIVNIAMGIMVSDLMLTVGIIL